MSREFCIFCRVPAAPAERFSRLRPLQSRSERTGSTSISYPFGVFQSRKALAQPQGACHLFWPVYIAGRFRNQESRVDSFRGSLDLGGRSGDCVESGSCAASCAFFLSARDLRGFTNVRQGKSEVGNESKDNNFSERAQEEPSLSRQLCCKLCASIVQHFAQACDQRTTSFRFFFETTFLVHRPRLASLSVPSLLLQLRFGDASCRGSSAASCTSYLRTAHAGLPTAEQGGRRQSSFLDFDDAHFHFSHLFSAVDGLFDSWLDRLLSDTSQQQKEMRFFSACGGGTRSRGIFRARERIGSVELWSTEGSTSDGAGGPVFCGVVWT